MFPNFMNNVREHLDSVTQDVAARANRFRNSNNDNNNHFGPDAAAAAAANLFGFGGRPPSQSTQNPQQQQQQQQQQNQRAPPASTKALRQLPTIRVSPEELSDPNNRECCVCLENHMLDERVTRLPCAHIFHSHCILDWLTHHSCTCPVCRYELPTDDPQYEQGRLERMKARKPRFAMHELNRMAVPELLALRRRPVPTGAMEKKELIQLLIDNEWIDIIPSPEPVQYRLDTLKNMKIRELKHCMEEAGVYFRPEDVVEKSDMITIFQNSGRLVVIEPPVEEETTTTTTATSVRSTTATVSQPDDQNQASSSAQRSITGYPGHRPTVQTVTEEDSDDEDMATPHIYGHSSQAEVLFPQQQEELCTLRSESYNSTFIEAQWTEQVTAAASAETLEVHDTPMSDVSNESTTIAPSSDDVHDNSTPEEQQVPEDSGMSPTDVESSSPERPTEIRQPWDPRDTFQNYTISNLQDLARDADIDISSCFERREMVDMMVRAGIFGTDEPSDLHPALFQSWSVSQLRVVASEAKIDLSSCHARHEMIETILVAANSERQYLRDYLRSLSPLTKKPLPELRSIAREWRVDISDCLEKDEIIGRLISRSTSQGVC
ncbi:ring finger domain containing protein [Nitzschia inconspicua]|uniref:Ring finger domain containing protein n=1 Tax=Nitzschia inconspicua TaxID=303405 RepID=A0A9K3LM77_9STRA|nr:ring finger domain containing protein [Nitzschia inconspicua]